MMMGRRGQFAVDAAASIAIIGTLAASYFAIFGHLLVDVRIDDAFYKTSIVGDRAALTVDTMTSVGHGSMVRFSLIDIVGAKRVPADGGWVEEAAYTATIKGVRDDKGGHQYYYLTTLLLENRDGGSEAITPLKERVRSMIVPLVDAGGVDVRPVGVTIVIDIRPVILSFFSGGRVERWG